MTAVAARRGAGERSAPVSIEAGTWLRLAAFFGLAAFGAAHWGALVETRSGGRTLLVVLVATGGATFLALLGTSAVRAALTGALGGRARLAGGLIVSLALVVGLLTTALGLGAAGLPLRLLGPENWGELFDGLDRGLAGVEGVEWPYDGPDEWIRLSILLGAPFLLGIAATVAFFPARRAARLLRGAGLVVLLLLYGTAVTEHDMGTPMLRGLVLLGLVAAWLWLPRLSAREAAGGAALVATVGVLSLPLAAALDAERPWWDYRAWNWFGGGKSITFDWNHQYGPLDWPRKGTTLLNIRSDRPHYWKAETLDTFDGLRWLRTTDNDTRSVTAELPDRSLEEGATWQPFEWNPRWDEEIRVTVRSLASSLVVGAGTTYYVDGVGASPSSDGTWRINGQPLEKGDSYTFNAYAPDPTRAQLQAAPSDYPGEYRQYTRIYLPTGSDDATELGAPGGAKAFAVRRELDVPMPGDPLAGNRNAGAILMHSRYRRMYQLALQLTAGAENSYDAVKAIETHLQDEYVYAETVPTRPIPLNGFLFEDERGYCQQFSGAMALMLRMVGVPARVAAGFSPGSYNRDTREFRVRDLDAHSWVEVYFAGIGWVPFDPTPTIAPAESQFTGFGATSAARADAGEVKARQPGLLSERTQLAPGASGDDGGLDWILPLLVVIVLSTGAGVAGTTALRIRTRRGLTAAQLADAQLAELRQALARLDWDLPTATTLLALEKRLGRAAGPASAGYAARLRAHRYDPREPSAPGPRERRALRGELTRRRGLRGRLRGLLVIPPGGPRPV
jgi:transglutaminase-like putative cysteine protease